MTVVAGILSMAIWFGSWFVLDEYVLKGKSGVWFAVWFFFGWFPSMLAAVFIIAALGFDMGSSGSYREGPNCYQTPQGVVCD